MAKTLSADRSKVARESYHIVCDKAGTLDEETINHHRCLVSEYMAYTTAASYSMLPQSLRERERGAWQFLERFPDLVGWLNLPLEEQLNSGLDQRMFVHYLFLRRFLPVTLPYILVASPHIGDMGRRLMERETYQRYLKMACRLGYRESGIRRQFQALLCLMSWTQKPLDHLTVSDLEAFSDALRSAYHGLDGRRPGLCVTHGLPSSWHNQLQGLRNVLYHLGIFPQMTLQESRKITFQEEWRQIPPDISATVYRYLQQMTQYFRPKSLRMERTRLFRFFSWLATAMPEITTIKEIQRRHIEAFKEYLRWAPPHPRFRRPPRATLNRSTQHHILSSLHMFFQRIAEWQWPETPDRPLMFRQDLPALEKPLPRFLNDVEAVSFLEAARNQTDLFTRVCGVTLLFTAVRESEFLDLTADCVVQIGDNYWLRVPPGKSGRDRYVPLYHEVKLLLDEWMNQHPIQRPSDFLFTRYGRRIGPGRVALAVQRIATDAGIPHRVTPHRLRHTMATLAVNRDMPLESIAALLGHRSLSTTMVYARIANRTVQQEYAAVSQQLEQLYNQPSQPADAKNKASIPIAEGEQMRQLRHDHWRMLGNGYCTRPEGVRCEYETICESCPCFSTTVEFLPILHKQREDAKNKGQTQRAQIFGQLIQRMESDPNRSTQ